MNRIQDSIEVNAPLETACDQWTRFEDFPRFMDGVDTVERVDGETLRWTATRDGLTGSWRALAVDQQPHERIARAATGGAPDGVEVTFRSLGPERTRVDLALDVEPEVVGGAQRPLEARVTGGLERFKDFIEGRGVGRGAWREQVTGGPVTGARAGTVDDSSLAGLARPAAARRAATESLAGVAAGMGTDLGAWETERPPAERASGDAADGLDGNELVGGAGFAAGQAEGPASDHPVGLGTGFATGQASGPLSDHAPGEGAGFATGQTEEAVSDHPPGRGSGSPRAQAGAPLNDPDSGVDVDARDQGLT